jgi:hypothetical protein
MGKASTRFGGMAETSEHGKSGPTMQGSVSFAAPDVVQQALALA